MSRPGSQRAAAPRPALWGAALAALSVLLSLVRFPPGSLWMDEVWSATSAAVPPWDAVLLTLRYDLHPPLYYLQLSLWGLLGQSDAWLFLNSVAWAAAVWLLTWLTSRRHGLPLGVTAGLLLAVAPLSGVYQHELRMYTMLMALAVLAYEAIERALEPHAPARAWWLMVLSLWLIAYAHGVGPLMAASLGLYALLRALDLGPQRLRGMMVALIVSGIGCLPVLLNSLLRTVGYPRPTLGEIAGSLAAFIAGSGEQQAALVIGLVGFGLLVGAGTVWRPTRRLTAAVILGPVLLVAVLSLLVKPFWQTRLFVFALPLGCLVAAQLIRGLADRRRRLALGLLAVLVLAGAGQTVALHRQAELQQDYRRAATLLQARVEPGDTVYGARIWDFWAVLRYLHGPRWGSPLLVQGEAAAGQWRRRLADLGRLGAPLAGLLGPGDSTDRLVLDGVTYVAGPGAPSTLAASGRVWVVQSLWQGEEAPLLRGHEVRETLAVTGLRLVRYEVAGSP